MSWPNRPWSAGGNWYSLEGEALSGQSQTNAASATIEISGEAITGQARQSSSVSAGNIGHLIGEIETTQGRQGATLSGAIDYPGEQRSAQGQSTSAAGGIEISGSASTGQAQTSKASAYNSRRPINEALLKMVEYPNAAAFDKDSHQVLALRLGQGQDVAWSVASGVLDVSDGTFVRKYPLESFTLGQIASFMQRNGIEVEYVNPNLSALSAAVLLDGSNSVASSNGNRLYAYGSLLWCLYGAQGVEVDDAKYRMAEALRQMIIWQSSGSWLEAWGDLYSVIRPSGYNEQRYADLIPREAFRERVNALAIEKAILEATGKDVRIEEPWGDMFRLSESAMSGSQKFYDGSRVGYHLIRPTSSKSIDWTDVLDVVERNRASGIVIMEPEVRLGSFVDAGLSGTVSMLQTNTNAALIQPELIGRLGELVLSGGDEHPRNYEVMVSQLHTSSGVALRTWAAGGGWNDAPWTLEVEGTQCPTWASMAYYSESASDGEAVTVEIDGEWGHAGHHYDFDIIEIG